jgi:hypothetical protein
MRQLIAGFVFLAALAVGADARDAIPIAPTCGAQPADRACAADPRLAAPWVISQSDQFKRCVASCVADVCRRNPTDACSGYYRRVCERYQ